MRGKAAHYTGGSIECRITPAYAGKSIFACDAGAVVWDHPRLCGEKIQLPFCFFWYGGSPPPMRGKVIVPTSAGTNRRITPAYAGKSIKKSKTYLLRWDHPRLCGEKTKKIPKQRYFFHQPASFSFSLQYT